MSDWSGIQLWKARAGFRLQFLFRREESPENAFLSEGAQLLRSAARHGIGHEQEVE